MVCGDGVRVFRVMCELGPVGLRWFWWAVIRSFKFDKLHRKVPLSPLLLKHDFFSYFFSSHQRRGEIFIIIVFLFS